MRAQTLIEYIPTFRHMIYMFLKIDKEDVFYKKSLPIRNILLGHKYKN